MRTEQIEGHQVAVFENKSEQDVWTTYVAFPKPNLAVAATNQDYLREVLARIDGKPGERALPDTLPEWKHVDIHAQFWAVRHCRKTGLQADPTSPFCGCAAMNTDDQAIGLTFSFDPDKSKTATITYLSGNENGLRGFQEKYFRERSPAATQMHAQYREVDAAAIEGSRRCRSNRTGRLLPFRPGSLVGPCDLRLNPGFAEQIQRHSSAVEAASLREQGLYRAAVPIVNRL